MKTAFILFFILLLCSLKVEAGLPPTTIKGQSDSAKAVNFNLQVPHKQATKQAGSYLLNNCGSDSNRLENCGFEHSSTAQGYSTSLTGTASVTVSVDTPSYFTEGNKSVNIECVGGASGGTCLFYQDVTTIQIQGSVKGLFQSDSASGVKVFSRVNGVNNLSKNIQSILPGLIPIPQVMGSTSTGIAVEITVAASQTINVKADSMFVGAQDVKSESSSGTPWISYTPTFIGFGTVGSIDCKYRQVLSNREIDCSFTSTSPTGVGATVSLPSGDVTASTWTGARKVGTYGNGATASTHGGFVLANPSVSELSFGHAGTFSNTSVNPLAATVGSNVASSGATIQFTASVALENLSSTVSTYSSTNADTDWASCGHTTSDFTGFGTVSAIETQCKRQGGDLLMRGPFTSGTSTAVEARVGLKFNGVAVTSKSVASIQSRQAAGTITQSANAGASWYALIEPSTAYYTVGQQSSGANGLSKITGSAFVLSGVRVSTLARIPIAGWENSNVIIASLSGLESCADSYECTDTFSAKVSSTGVVSGENIDWINGNCGATSPRLCTFNTGIFTAAPNCTLTINDNANWSAYFSVPATAISTTVQTYNDVAGAVTNTAFIISCQKQGADYIGKTAKAVASDQNVRSIGSINVDIQSVYFGSSADCSTACTTGTCTICNQVGGKITSVSFASSGAYNVNGIDGSKYNCTGNGYDGAGAAYRPFLHQRVASTSSFARIQNGAANVGFNSVTCIGIP